ncbi:ubiquinol-cytochrome C reductase, iron-sulfur subunit [Thioalkalivibrio sp.]|uniref:ubiquinol-cytochrome C reductase, iron-sulfur subunit n=1 Tax=Thioalkalivibrio sp. TaxID=2093813 RepID=UPI003563C4A7
MQAENESLARVRIRALMKLMVLAAALLLMVVMLGYAFSGPVDTRGETLRVDLGEIAPGEAGRFVHGNRHVLVVHRDAAWQAALADDDELVDPGARRGQQPDGLDLPLRSFRPEWLVVIGEGTDLGCELDLVHPDDAEDWSGGFVDRCRGGRYDGAGRVYAEQSARRNLPIPDYRFVGDEQLILENP